MNNAKCKACKQDIFWVRMESGSNMPVDTRRLSVIVTSPDNGNGKVVSAYESHWSTCPHADRFKKKGEKGEEK